MVDLFGILWLGCWRSVENRHHAEASVAFALAAASRCLTLNVDRKRNIRPSKCVDCQRVEKVTQRSGSSLGSRTEISIHKADTHMKPRTRHRAK